MTIGRTFLMILLCGATLFAQTSGLKIVVLKGEDAVNIIQQKTAVAPLVEVRDRNNLPVPGATVTFTIGGQGGAAFGGGASTFTLTTNAAGQAAAAGLTPTGAGAVQINVAAAFQGQTAAVSIAQTNVLTAAQAAAATGGAAGTGTGTGGAGTAAGTGGAATGGGLSTGAVVGIVGGGLAVVGGVVAKGALGGSGDERGTSGSPNQPGAPTCTFAVSPTTVSVPIEGGTVVVSVTVSPAGCSNPTWIVSKIESFVTVDKTSVTGSGSVTLTVAPFTPAPNFPTRTGAVGVADTVVQILQPRQIGSTATACASQQRRGAASSEVSTFELGSTIGTFEVTFAPGLDSSNRMLVVYEGLTLFDSGCGTAPPIGTRSISYSGRSSTVTIQVSPACGVGARTEWQYQVSCPR